MVEANNVIVDKYKAELNARRDISYFVTDLDDGVPLENYRNKAELAMIRIR